MSFHKRYSSSCMFRFPWMRANLLCSWNQTSESSLLCISSQLWPSCLWPGSLTWSLFYIPAFSPPLFFVFCFFITSPLGCSQCLGAGLPALDGSVVQYLYVTAFWKVVLLVQSCGYIQLHERSFLRLYQIIRAFL